MAFNPDEYLASKTQSQGFDPDAYLAGKTPPSYDPTEGMSGTEKFLAGTGKAFADIGRGVGQLVGVVSPEDIAEARRLEAPLMKTGAGFAGNIAGNIAAAIPTMAIPGAATARGAALIGAGLGGLQPVTQDESRLGNVALGGAFGAAGALAPRAVARVVNPKAVQTVKESVGELTPGQALGGVFKTAEEKMTSLPWAGSSVAKAQRQSVESFNKGVLDKVLEPIGSKAQKIGHEGVAEVGDKISTAYQNLLPKLKVQADDAFVQQLNGVKELATSLPDDKANQLVRIIDQKVMGKFTQDGLMSGETMKQVDSELGRLIRGYKSSANFDERQLGDALRETQAALRTMVERNNPSEAGNIQKINDAFARFIRVERAAGGVGAKEGIFTPAQLTSAVKATDTSLRKGSFARGQAMMQDIAKKAEQTIGNKYPDSGTAGRLGQIGSIGAYAYNPMLAIGEGAVAGAYEIPQLRNTLLSLVAKRPEMAGDVANYLRLLSPATARIGALGGSAYVGQQ